MRSSKPARPGHSSPRSRPPLVRGLAGCAPLRRAGATALALALLVQVLLWGGPAAGALVWRGIDVSGESPGVRTQYVIEYERSRDELGDWTHYGAIVFDTVAVTGADTEGPMAVGKRFGIYDKATTSYDIGYSITESYSEIGFYENEGGYPSFLFGGNGAERTSDVTYGSKNTLYFGSAVDENNRTTAKPQVYAGPVVMSEAMHRRNRWLNIDEWRYGMMQAVSQTVNGRTYGGTYDMASQETLDDWFSYWYDYTTGASQQFLRAGQGTPTITLAEFTSYWPYWWEAKGGLGAFKNQYLTLEGESEPDSKTLVIDIDCTAKTSFNFGYNGGGGPMQIPASLLRQTDGTPSSDWKVARGQLTYDLIIFNFIGLTNVTLDGAPQAMDGTITQMDGRWRTLTTVAQKLERIATCSNTIYNFPDAKTITSTTGAYFAGAVLAPDATFRGEGGALNGQLVAQNYIQVNGHEIHALPLTRKAFEITEDPAPNSKVILFKYLKYGDKVTETRIGGASFILWREGENGREYYTGEGFSPSRGDAREYRPTADTRVEIEGLDYGTYWLEETEAPEGYLLNDSDESDTDTYYLHEFKISEQAPEVTLCRYNEPLGIDLYFYKHYLDDSGTNVRRPLEGVEFQLFRKADDYYSEEGDVRYTSEQLITDENGLLHIPQIPVGKYILREVHTPAGFTYVLENGELDFSVRNQDPGDGLGKRLLVYRGHTDDGWKDPANWLSDIETTGYGVENRFVDTKTVVSLYKHDSESESLPLSGAKFTLWYWHPDHGEWRQMTSNDLMTVAGEEWGVSREGGDSRYKSLDPIVITSSIGYFTVENLPPGTYRLVEEAAPEGYEADNSLLDSGFPYNGGHYCREFTLEFTPSATGPAGDAAAPATGSEPRQAPADGYHAGQPPDEHPSLEEEYVPHDDAPEDEGAEAGPEAPSEPPADKEDDEAPLVGESEGDPGEDGDETSSLATPALAAIGPLTWIDAPPEAAKPAGEEQAAEAAEEGLAPGAFETASDMPAAPAANVPAGFGEVLVRIPNQAAEIPVTSLRIEKWGEVPGPDGLETALLNTDEAQFRLDRRNTLTGEYNIELLTLSTGTTQGGVIELAGLVAGEYRLVERKAPTGYTGLNGDYLTPEENDFIYFTLAPAGGDLAITDMRLAYWREEPLAVQADEGPPGPDSPLAWTLEADGAANAVLCLQIYNRASTASLKLVKIDGDIYFEGYTESGAQADPASGEYRVIIRPVVGAVFRLQRQRVNADGTLGRWENYTSQRLVSELLQNSDGSQMLDEYGNEVAGILFDEPLIWGHYRLVEIETPKGYTVEPGNSLAVSTGEGESGPVVAEFYINPGTGEGFVESVTVRNYTEEARGDITVKKVDLDETGEETGVADVPFRLWRISGGTTDQWDQHVTLAQAVAEWEELEFKKAYSENDFITGSDGTLKLENLAPGLYALYETWDPRYQTGEDGGFLVQKYLHYLSHQVVLQGEGDVNQDFYFHLTLFRVVAVDENDIDKGVRVKWVHQPKIAAGEATFDNQTHTADGWTLEAHGADGGHLTIRVHNRRLADLPIDVTLQKVDEKGEPLAGSEFTLYKRTDFTTEAPDLADPTAHYSPVDTQTSGLDGVVRFESLGAAWRWVADTEIAGEEGGPGLQYKKGVEAAYRFHENLTMWSEYLLVETAAPDGYAQSSRAIPFMLWANPDSKSLDLIELYYGDNALYHPGDFTAGLPATAARLGALFYGTPFAVDPARLEGDAWWRKSYTEPAAGGYDLGSFASEHHLGTWANSRTPVDFSFVKYDADWLDAQSGGTLAGAQFVLYSCTQGGAGHSHRNQVAAAGSCWAPLATATADESGRVAFGGLPPGEYRMVESRAPEGYERALACWRVTLAASGEAGLEYLPLRGEAGPGLARSADGAWRVGNRPRYQLPVFGGVGVWPYLLGGGLLLLSALGLLAFGLRRQGRDARRRHRRAHSKILYRRGKPDSS